MQFRSLHAVATAPTLEGKRAAFHLSPKAVVLVRDTGVEFLCSQPVALFTEFELHLRVDRESFRTSAVVVGCQSIGPATWRVSLLFASDAAGHENLSLAA